MKPPLFSRISHFMQKKMGLHDQFYKQEFFGKTFFVPSINGRKTYVSEFWMAGLIQLLLPLKSGAFVDVGANLGQTLLKVVAVDPSRPYIGFEPNPTCADYLFELIARNSLKHVVIPAGLGATTGVHLLNMYRQETTDPSASLVTEFRGTPVGTKPVVVIGWDDLPHDVRKQQVAIVKIDVEGGEKEVLEGLIELLNDQRPFILVEVLPPHSVDNHLRIDRQNAVEVLLERANYFIFRVVKSDTDDFVGLTLVDEFGVHSDLSLCDYLLVHRDDAHLMASSRVA